MPVKPTPARYDYERSSPPLRWRLLDLVRIAGPLGVSELSDAMEVTPTAVRQRLMRLMAQSLIQREAIRTAAAGPSTVTG